MCGSVARTGAALAVFVVLLGALGSIGEAGWLSRLSRHAGDAGDIAKLEGLGALGEAARHVSRLPGRGSGITLAAHVTPEGHWKFVNREGQVFTAAGAEEMARVVKSLEPAAPAHARLSLYLSEEAAFAGAAALKDLPEDARLYVVTGDRSFRLRAGPDKRLTAELGTNLVLDLDDRAMFREAVFHLARPINKSSIRVLALEPTGPKRLSSVPSYDPATKAALVDPIDPAALGATLGRLKYQTIVVTGRVEGDSLVYKPASGAEGSLSITALARAAEEAEVNLVVLNASLKRQPGGRNWLWQTVSVTGLDDALERATHADFLSALAAGRGELSVSARPSTAGRIVISVGPSGNSAQPMTDAVSTWVTEKAGAIMGQMVVEGIEAFVPDQARQEELDLRLVPGVPSSLQFAYLISLVAGLIGWEHAFAWFARIWPPETREEYRGAFGYHAARLVRLVALVLIFLPILGLPALVATMLTQLWRLLTAPIRWWRRLRGETAHAGH